MTHDTQQQKTISSTEKTIQKKSNKINCYYTIDGTKHFSNFYQIINQN